jgi:hypothetical protein
MNDFLVVHHSQEGRRGCGCLGVDQARECREDRPSVAQVPHPNLKKVHGPLSLSSQGSRGSCTIYQYRLISVGP